MCFCFDLDPFLKRINFMLQKLTWFKKKNVFYHFLCSWIDVICFFSSHFLLNFALQCVHLCGFIPPWTSIWCWDMELVRNLLLQMGHSMYFCSVLSWIFRHPSLPYISSFKCFISVYRWACLLTTVKMDNGKPFSVE